MEVSLREPLPLTPSIKEAQTLLLDPITGSAMVLGVPLFGACP